MDDLVNDPKVHSVLVAVLVAAGGWFVRREVKRIDEALAEAVKRNELDQLRQESDARHRENKSTMGEIKQTVSETHRRIDQLYRDLFPGRH